VKTLLHCPAKKVVFQPTATIALNVILQGLIATGVKNVYISPFEHNAVTRTLHHFEQNGAISVYQLTVSCELVYDLERIRYQFEAVRPDLVVMSHASNVIGLVAPVEDVFRQAKNFGAFTVVDMAQTAGLVDLNVGSEAVDFAVFAGHKSLLGPTGVSGFVMKPGINLPPVLFGGTGFESANQEMPLSIPERFEAGTLNAVGVAGLNASLRWIEEQSIDILLAKEQKNRQRLLELLQSYDYLTVVGNLPDHEYVGIVSCLMDEISSDSAGDLFSRRNISVRTGLHCAPMAHRFLGTFPAGTIRFSVNALTTDADFEELEAVLDDLEEELG
jgi:cysteine desulfurase family protein